MKSSRALTPLLALRAFESASRHLSFSRAASELCVTQSAISRHIKNLEDSFQKKLFIRRGRSVLLSPEGQQLFEKLTIGFGLIDEATKAFANNRDDGILRLNVLPTLGMRWLAPRLHQFSQLYSNIEIHLISSIEPVSFGSGDLDIAIRVGQMPERARVAGERHKDQAAKGKLAKIDLEMLDDWEGIQGVPLFSDILVAVYNPELLSPPDTPSDLSKHVLISTMTRASAWDDWFRIGGLAPVAGRRRLSFGHFFMSLQAALEGKGIAMLPEVLIEQELASGRLKRLFHKAESAGRYHLLFRELETDRKKIRLFRDWVTEAAAEYRRSLGR